MKETLKTSIQYKKLQEPSLVTAAVVARFTDGADSSSSSRRLAASSLHSISDKRFFYFCFYLFFPSLFGWFCCVVLTLMV